MIQSFWGVILVLGVSLRTASTEPDLLLADFEGPDYGDWQVTGEAFGSGPAHGTLPNQMEVSGFEGQGLVNSYASGEGCETAPQSVMGLSLSELEQEWRRAALNDNVLGAALEALLPWGTLLLVVFSVPLLLVLTSLRKSPRPRPSQA